MRVLPGLLACVFTTDLLSNTGVHSHQHFDNEESRGLYLQKCRTVPPSDEEIAKSEKVMAKYPKQDFSRMRNIVIQAYFHVITDGDTGKLTDAQIASSINVLNVGFGPTFTFNLAGKTETDNRYWYNDINSETAFKSALRVGGCDVLNIYSTSGFGALGFAYYPDSCSYNPNDGVVIASSTTPGGEFPYNEGKTLTHEVGHFLGLYHTFDGGCDGLGDNIDDTPAHAGPDMECDETLDTCPSSGYNPIENFMNYTPDACMYQFTNDQFNRMIAMWNEYRPPAPPSTPPPVTQPTPAPFYSPITQPTVNCATSEVELRVEVTTDSYPGETSWNINDGNQIIMSASIMEYTRPNYLYKSYVCVASNPECLTLTIYDSFGDGIKVFNAFKVYMDEGEIFTSKGSFFFTGTQLIVSLIDGCGNKPTTAPPTVSPSTSPVVQPTINCATSEVELRVQVTTDNYSLETSWNVADCNVIIMSVSAAEYTESNKLYMKSVCVPSNPECLTLTIFDSFGDGINVFNAFKVYMDEGEIYTSGSSFTTGFELIVNLNDNTVNPTMTPVRNPTNIPVFPSKSPVAQPTINCVTSEVELRVQVTTDNYSLETSWNVADCNEIIMSVSAAEYTESNTLYMKSVCVPSNPECLTLTIFDSYGDGIVGLDSVKVYMDEGEIYTSGSSFTTGAVLIVNLDDRTVNPTMTPVRNPTNIPVRNPAQSPVDQPTRSNCPAGQSMFAANVSTDSNGDKIKVLVKKKNKRNKWRRKLMIRDGFPSNVLTTVSTCLSNDNCYRFTISDRDKDGLCCEAGIGYYSLMWKGEEIKNNLFMKGRRKFTKFNCPK